MGTFFLLTGTALFFSSLGCLLAVFISNLARLKTSKASSVYLRRQSNLRNVILVAAGILLVTVSQGFYWFHEEVSRYVAFEDSIPEARISFLYEELRTPRIILTSSDENHRISSQIIPFLGDSIYIAAEVITWKKMFTILGLKECYHLYGIYYDGFESGAADEAPHPDYELKGGQSTLAWLISSLGALFPADASIYLTPALAANSEFEYLVEISPDSIYYSQSFDIRPTANYPY